MQRLADGWRRLASEAIDRGTDLLGTGQDLGDDRLGLIDALCHAKLERKPASPIGN